MRLKLATFASLVLHAVAIRSTEVKGNVTEPGAESDEALEMAWYSFQPRVEGILQSKIRADVGEIYQDNVCICRKSSLTHDCNTNMGSWPHWLTATNGQLSSKVKEQYVCCQWKPWPNGIEYMRRPKKENEQTFQYNLIKVGHATKSNMKTYYPSFCFAGFNSPMDACPMNEEGTAPVARAHAETYAELWTMKKKAVSEQLVPKVKMWMKQRIKWAKAHPKEVAWHVFKLAGQLAFTAVGLAIIAGCISLCPACMAAFVIGKIALAVVHVLVTRNAGKGAGQAGVQVIGVTAEATAVLLSFIAPAADIAVGIVKGVQGAAGVVAAAFPAKVAMVNKVFGYRPNTFWEELAVQCQTAEVLSKDTPLQLSSLLLDEEKRKRLLYKIDKDRAGFVENVRLRWKDQSDERCKRWTCEKGARLDEKMVQELEEQIYALQNASSDGHLFRCDFVLSQVYESMDTIKKYVARKSFESDIIKRDIPHGIFCDSFEVD